MCLNEYDFDYTSNQADELKEDFKRCCIKRDFPDHKMYQRTFVYDNEFKIIESDIQFLAIDFGGTSLKLGLFKVINQQITEIKETIYIIIPPAEKISDIDPFEWVVEQVSKYLGTFEGNLLAGMTFSYPMKLKSIDSCEILDLTKNFHFVRPEKGVDPVAILNLIFKSKKMNITVKAIANDTIATLMSIPKVNKDHRVGIVLGTGTNGAYFPNENNGIAEAINIEWGNFDSPYLKKNECDYSFREDRAMRNDKTNNLDSMIGGYGFLYNLNWATKNLLGYKNKLSIQDVKKIINKKNKKKKEIFTLIKCIKRRSMTIISALVMGALESNHIKPDETVTLILNGTIFDQKFDQILFEKEMLKMFNRSKLNIKRLRFATPKNASLIGIIHILLSNL